jgi:hypothetical protein
MQSQSKPQFFVGKKWRPTAGIMVCLHEQCFSVSDASAASKDRNNPIFCVVSDAAVASDTEKHCSCKQTLKAKGHICP